MLHTSRLLWELAGEQKAINDFKCMTQAGKDQTPSLRQAEFHHYVPEVDTLKPQYSTHDRQKSSKKNLQTTKDMREWRAYPLDDCIHQLIQGLERTLKEVILCLCLIRQVVFRRPRVRVKRRYFTF